MEWSLRPGDLAGVPALRRRIMAHLRRLADPTGDLSAAEVVVAELLSNAVAHTRGPAWVTLRWNGLHPLLSVADLGPGFAGLPVPTQPADGGGAGAVPEQPTPANAPQAGTARTELSHRTLAPTLPTDPLADGGRGLYLAAQLALDLAVAPRATGGSVVSATLNLTRATPRDGHDPDLEERPAPRRRGRSTPGGRARIS